MEQNSIKVKHPVIFTATFFKWFFIIILSLAALTGGYYAWQYWNTSQAAVSETQVKTITTAEFEQLYGLRVRLIGVTAEGGLIDFRLKVIDVDKAKQVLSDPSKIPSLIVPEKGITLTVPQDSDQDLVLTEGGIVFFLIGNTGGAVQPGTQVIVSFDEFQLEPLPAQ